MSPHVVARYTQNRYRIFAKHARLLHNRTLAFTASKRTAKTENFLRKENSDTKQTYSLAHSVCG